MYTVYLHIVCYRIVTLRSNSRSSAIAEIARIGGHCAVQGHLSSLILVPLERVCDFLLVNNTNSRPISDCSQVIADYWSNLRFRQKERVPFFNTLVRVVNPRTHNHEISFQGTRNIALSYHVLQNAFLYLEEFRRYVDHVCDGRTDGHTEPFTS